jgi:transposase
MARPSLSARPPATPAEERRLRKLAAAQHAPASRIQRARIITASWDGASVAELAERLGCHPKTASRWPHRFNQTPGTDGLADLPRPGLPQRISEHERGRLIALAGSEPPGRLQQGGEGLLAPDQPQAPARWTWTRSPRLPRPRASGWVVARCAASCCRRRPLAAAALVDDQHRPRLRPKEPRSSPALPPRPKKRP